MKRLLSLVSTLVLLATVSACSQDSDNKNQAPSASAKTDTAAASNNDAVGLPAPSLPSSLSNNNLFILNTPLLLQNEQDPASSTFIFSRRHVYQQVTAQMFIVSSDAEPSPVGSELAARVLSETHCSVTGTDLEMGTNYVFNAAQSNEVASSERHISLIGSALNEDIVRTGAAVQMNCFISVADATRGEVVVDEMFDESIVITDGMSELISAPVASANSAVQE